MFSAIARLFTWKRKTLTVFLVVIPTLVLVITYSKLNESGLSHIKLNGGGDRVVTLRSSYESDDEFMKRMKRRMDERRTQLQQSCKRLGIYHNGSEIHEKLIYSDKYKAIFCQIPKTGVTNWKYVFAALEGVGFQSDKAGLYRKNHQISSAEKNERLNNPNWFKMTVVREPLERLVSAYRSKVEPQGLIQRIALDNLLHPSSSNQDEQGQIDGKEVTFSEFVNFLVEQNFNQIRPKNLHWAKYAELCQPCDFNYDVIGHQETIAEDSKYVLRLIGAPEELSLKSPYTNKTDEDLVYRYFSTVRPRSRVFQLYSLLLEDYLLFGYPPPLVLDRLSKEQKNVSSP